MYNCTIQWHVANQTLNPKPRNNMYTAAAWMFLRSTRVPFPPNIRCAGWGWWRSTLGCSPPFNMLLLCVGEAPLLVKQWAGHILAYKRWLQWVFICAKVGIASDAVTGWETWGHRCDSLMHIYLISSNAFDLYLNVWPPERVFHDTYPIQLLRSNYHLPMFSVMGNSIRGVEIYTSHELGIFLTLYSRRSGFNWKTIIYLCIAPTYGEITTSVPPYCASKSPKKCFSIYILFACSYLNAWALSNAICNMYPWSDYPVVSIHEEEPPLPRSETPIGLKRLLYQSYRWKVMKMWTQKVTFFVFNEQIL